jgi:hypothetical protein
VGWAMVAYLGEERALVVGELHLRDVEELELPLSRGQRRLVRSRCLLSPESRPFCYRSIVRLLLIVRELPTVVTYRRHSSLSYGHPGRRYRGTHRLVAQLQPAPACDVTRPRLTERSAARAWQRTSLLLSLSCPSIAFPITLPTSHFPLHSTTCNLHFAHLLLCAQASTRARDNWPSPSCLVPCLNTSRRQPSRARCITSAHPL